MKVYLGKSLSPPSTASHSGLSTEAAPTAPLLALANPEEYLPPAFFECARMTGHCTLGAVIRHPKVANYNDRSHIRLLLKSQGILMSKFDRSKRAVKAIRDAIRGHELACLAGLLHRDISEGNVLMATGEELAGFLCDFDYSSISVFGDDEPEHDVDGNSKSRLTASEVVKELKERTGTTYFMATELLHREDVVHEAHHDLESFFWLLVWIVVRYTEHTHRFGAETAVSFFTLKRRGSVGDEDRVPPRREISGGERQRAFTYLVRTFASLVSKRQDWVKEDGEDFLTHKVVLALFDEALDMKGWPEGDAAKPYIPPQAIPEPHAESHYMKDLKAARLSQKNRKAGSKNGSQAQQMQKLDVDQSSQGSTKGNRREEEMTEMRESSYSEFGNSLGLKRSYKEAEMVGDDSQKKWRKFSTGKDEI